MSRPTKPSTTTHHGRFKIHSIAIGCLLALMASTSPAGAFVQSPMAGATPAVSTSSSLYSGNGDSSMALPPEMEKALEQKNASRKKFGLQPLSVPEFLQLQTQVRDMEQEMAVKMARQMEDHGRRQPQSDSSPFSFAQKLFESTLEDTCQSNFDCESPKVCCDLGFKKMCCSSGIMQRQQELALVPIPVDMRK